MKNKPLLTGIITVIAGLILAITGWNFSATQGAVQKEDHRPEHRRLEEKIDKIYDMVLDIYKRGKE